MFTMKQTLKKVLVLLLCFLCMTSSLSAFAVTKEDDVASLLSAMSIISGYPDGELHLEKTVTRAEFCKIAIMASSYKNQVASGISVSPFSDVSYKHWAAPYIKLSLANGLVKGYPDSTFRPENTVLYEEAVTIFLGLLGYTATDFGYSWPYGQLGLADNIGLTEEVGATVGTPLTRREVMLLCYNLLTCHLKGGNNDYLESINYKLIEDVVLIATAKEDSSVPGGKVATSSGTYKIDKAFSSSHLGKTGNVILKNGDTLVSFIPYEQAGEEHVVYSLLSDAILVYDNGSVRQISVSDQTVCYKGTQKTTYNAVKSTLSMGDSVYVKRDANGNTEYISVREGNTVGPVVVKNALWYQELSIGQNVTVMRNGTKCTLDDVKVNDVAYFSPALNMVMVYTKKVTGIYEAASPNKDQPETVTISGVNYSLETAEAFNAFSSNGSYRYGDTVTVLLGKDGAIAGIAGNTSATSSMVGYFQSAGVKEYISQSGETYTNFYATVIAADGTPYTYATRRDYSGSDYLNQVVRVSITDGLGTVGLYQQDGISGTVNAAEKRLDRKYFADSVNILDVVLNDSAKTGAYTSVFLQRLDGVNLSASSVLYYDYDEDGKISDLILKDVTGDCWAYGVVTKAQSTNQGMSARGQYSYDIAGASGSISTSGMTYNVGSGQGAMFLTAGGRPDTIKGLTLLSGKVTSVSGGVLKTSGGEEYLISDKVVVYKKVSGDYTTIPLSELESGSYNISAYFDKLESQGGRVRVLIAVAN